MNEGSTMAGRPLLAGAAALLFLAPATQAADLKLQDAIERALAQAPELRAAAAARSEAEASVRAAGSARKPELWVRTGPGYASGLPAPVLGELPAAFGVQLRAGLFDSDTRAGEARARAEAAAARGGVAGARVAVARATAEAFGRCLRDAAGLAAATDRAEERARAREQAEARLREGRATGLEVERAGLDEARAREDVADWRSRQELDRLTLAGLVGTKPEDLAPLSAESVAALGEPAPGDDLDRARVFDPELLALADSALHLDRAASVRRGWFQPVIQAEAQYSRLYRTADWDAYYSTFQPDNWSVGASIAVPLYSGGRLHAQAARARAAADEASAKREVRERELVLMVARARAELERARARADLAERAEALARRAMGEAEALADEGRLEPAERTRRRIELLEAEEETARARYQLLQTKIALLALRGDLG
jgi:outer membrane protein, multidrug efflux system